MAPKHVPYVDWIELKGYAVAEGPTGAITGQLIRHRRSGAPTEWSEPVKFKKGRWMSDLEKLSEAATHILSDPTIEDGHVVPKEKAAPPEQK